MAGVAVCAVLSLGPVGGSRAAAQNAPPVSSVEANVDADYGRGANMIGFTGGLGFGTLGFGGKSKHDLWFFNAHYGRVVADSTGEDHFWTGRWMVLGEVSVGRELNNDRNWTVSFSPLIRFFFDSPGRWVPFLEAGYGVTWTDIGEPDLGGEFQFKGQAGAGLHWFVYADFAFSFQYRFIHYSNAGLNRPNQGVNVHSGLVGLSYFF